MDRRNNFDAIRVLAASAVIYGHAHPITDTPDLVFFGSSVQSFAVKVFFVVSGFLVARSWASDQNTWRYLSKRVLRIFPALLLLLSLTILVLGPTMTTLPLAEYFRHPLTAMYFAYNVVLYPVYHLPGVFTGNPYPGAVNGSLWSLPAEFLMYLVFPLVFLAGRLLRANWLLVLFTISLCAASLYFVRVSPPASPFVFFGTGLPSVLDAGPYFFLGAIFSVTAMRKLLDTGVALFLIALLLFLQPQGALWMELSLYLVAPYCVLSLAIKASPFLQSFGRWGDPSYGIYLYGWPIQQVACHFIPNLSAIGNTLIALPLAVLAAYGSWHLLEKRALALKPRRAGAR